MKVFSLVLALIALATFAFAEVESQAPVPMAELEASESVTAPESATDANVPEVGPQGHEGLDFNPIVFDDQKSYQSKSCDPCRNACAATSAACKAGCGFDFNCIRQCNCDFYYCVDACTDCGPQDPPPAGC